MDCSVYYFRYLYSAGSACVYTNTQVGELPIDMATSSVHCLLIYFWFLQLFLHSDQPLLRWNNPCLAKARQSGEAALSTPRRCGHAPTDRPLWCATDETTSGNIITQSIIFSFSISANSSCILHRVQQHHADASACHRNCRVRQLQFFTFLSRWLCR